MNGMAFAGVLSGWFGLGSFLHLFFLLQLNKRSDSGIKGRTMVLLWLKLFFSFRFFCCVLD